MLVVDGVEVFCWARDLSLRDFEIATEMRTINTFRITTQSLGKQSTFPQLAYILIDTLLLLLAFSFKCALRKAHCFSPSKDGFSQAAGATHFNPPCLAL